MTLERFMNYILYTDKRPENISAARWCAMRTSIERKYDETLKKVKDCP
jgi:hypothetical protein